MNDDRHARSRKQRFVAANPSHPMKETNNETKNQFALKRKKQTADSLSFFFKDFFKKFGFWFRFNFSNLWLLLLGLVYIYRRNVLQWD
jgi:hypothetical protein